MGTRLITTGILLAGWLTVSAEDWPQWRGPARDGLSAEINLLQAWPPEGPLREWSIDGLGEGYGSVAVSGSQIFVQGTAGEQSVVLALDRSSGRRLWSTDIGRRLNHGRGGGPRGTPTVVGDSLWALTETGELARLDRNDGRIHWRRNILSDFGGRNPTWLISESPLVDAGRVIVTPGGRGAAVVALEADTGATVWQSSQLSDPAGYSSTVLMDVDGLETIVAFTARAAVGLKSVDGSLLWSYSPVANRTANVTTPVFFGNRVFLTSAYGTGSALLLLTRTGDGVDVEEVYFSREMQNHHGGVVLVDGHIYGFSNSVLTCLEAATGERRWRHRSVGKGSLTYADERLYLLSENHRVALARATPEGYQELGQFRIPDQGRPSWAHPVVSHGRLFIRDQGTLTAFDVRR